MIHLDNVNKADIVILQTIHAAVAANLPVFLFSILLSGAQQFHSVHCIHVTPVPAIVSGLGAL